MKPSSDAFPWEEIRLRFIAGEKPKAIAKDYPGLTARAISNRAYAEKWKIKKQALQKAADEQVEAAMVYSAMRNVELATNVVGKILQEYIDGNIANLGLVVTALKLAYPKAPGSNDNKPPASDEEIDKMTDGQLLEELKRFLPK